jgi:basic membrane lipoprotein Med (substrate-binding protein (PBP1-ABC) superfamily)
MSIGTARRYYVEALKQGQREYKDAMSRGTAPNIQALEQISDNVHCLTRVSLGQMEIPIYLIVGSTQTQRCASFSPSFFPLLESDSEFADKWIQLCNAQLEDGIRDPIKCYEYLGRFYVTEGNKRVSVLRSLGAVEITAEVIRLLPAEIDDYTRQLYEEFLEFYRHSRLYGVRFREPGGYARLQAALGLAPDQDWPEELRRQFQYSLMRFRERYYRMGGSVLGLTTGDVLLHYLQFYPPEEFLNQRDFRQNLQAIWKELCAIAEGQEISMSLEPAQEASRRSFSRAKVLRIAFLFQGTPETSPWTAAHDQGRRYLEEKLPDRVSVRCYYETSADNVDENIEQAVGEGADLIFTTTVNMLDATLRAAVRYPKVKLMNCSIDQPYINVRTYYSRVYEGKFITGAIAGAMSKDGRIGYIGSYPILGVPASINAFALGASLTNPEARLQLKWHCLPGDPIEEFRAEGISLVSDRDSNGVIQSSQALGLFRFGSNGEPVPLASPRWNWGEFYVHMVQEYLWDRRRATSEEENARAVNYWWGMRSGVVDLVLSPALPEGVRILAETLKGSIQSGTLQPFHRRITAQDGTLINDGSRNLSMDEILRIDWLSDLVEGSIPAYEELLPMARETVERLGITRSLGSVRLPEK